MAAGDLHTALAWLQARLDRELTIDTGTVILEALVRGREPDFRLDEDADSYELKLFVQVDSVRLYPVDLDAEITDDGELVMRTRAGQLTITE